MKKSILFLVVCILAAGCSICISSRIVTPSFVITISPVVSTSILSIPFGPNVLLTVFAGLVCWALIDQLLIKQVKHEFERVAALHFLWNEQLVQGVVLLAQEQPIEYHFGFSLNLVFLLVLSFLRLYLSHVSR